MVWWHCHMCSRFRNHTRRHNEPLNWAGLCDISKIKSKEITLTSYSFCNRTPILNVIVEMMQSSTKWDNSRSDPKVGTICADGRVTHLNKNTLPSYHNLWRKLTKYETMCFVWWHHSSILVMRYRTCVSLTCNIVEEIRKCCHGIGWDPTNPHMEIRCVTTPKVSNGMGPLR